MEVGLKRKQLLMKRQIFYCLNYFSIFRVKPKSMGDAPSLPGIIIIFLCSKLPIVMDMPER